jgi:hypothetical protein
MVGSISPPCNDSDTGFLGSDECLDANSVTVYNTRASAAAFTSREGYTYFLTAAHFCDTEAEIVSRYPPGLIFTERNIFKDDKETEFEIVKSDSRIDLCLIRANYEIDEEIHLASRMPDVGEQTKAISSPLGISEKNVNFHFSGIFSGCNDSQCFFTIPAISGSSGSVVLNYEDEIVGITQQSLIGFPEVTIGVGVHQIRNFLLEFKDETGIDLLEDESLLDSIF